MQQSRAKSPISTCLIQYKLRIVKFISNCTETLKITELAYDAQKNDSTTPSGAIMYAITGITGQVGGEVAQSLLNQKQQVRAVLRDANKTAKWVDLGCDIAIASLNDVASLTAAFAGAEGIFLLFPSLFDPTPDFAEARENFIAVKSALLAARPKKVVCLSTIGAQATEFNLLTSLGIMEQELGDIPMPITFLRAGWFIENCSWDVAPAKKDGVIPSFLQPIDKAYPMVATADIGRTAAELLQQIWSGRRVVELEGPRRIAPKDIAACFSKLLGKPVRMEPVPQEKWEEIFRSLGMKNPKPRMRMLDGFNEGWIDFEHGQANSIKGIVELQTVLQKLIG
jgi:uncharacterized protein YbjT (DUF2867 family)